MGISILRPGDSFDSFPKNIGVAKNGAILISDEDNNRIYIYNNDGTIKKVLALPPGLPAEDSVYGWPSSTGFVVYSGGNSFVLDCEYKTISGGIQPLKICFLDYNGNILNKADMSEVFAIETGLLLLKNNIYSLYSPTGQFLKTSAEKPLELGRVREQSLGSGRYKITIAYSDKEYSFIGDHLSDMEHTLHRRKGHRFQSHRRDRYGISQGTVFKTGEAYKKT